MRLRAHLLTILLLGGYTTAAVVPCAPVSTRGADTAQVEAVADGAASPHAGHRHHSAAKEPAAHSQRIASNDVSHDSSGAGTEWTAPCPCGCSQSSEAAGSSAARVGFALARAVPALESHDLSIAVVEASAFMPLSPLLGRDAVPI